MSEDSLSGFADLMVMNLETMDESAPAWNTLPGVLNTSEMPGVTVVMAYPFVPESCT